VPGHSLSKRIIGSEPPKKTLPPIDSRARLAAQITFAILLVLLALWVASDFLTALVWATVIAVTIWPVYARFAALINKDHLSVFAPLLFTLLTRAARRRVA
jgi:predicted PurR-regulated permease PerM